ncbi:YkgJ family cysteine cluster protein [Corallococcus praedator]|uniref:YkgJ family cysteine cluster protein n=1 Tax=Corallococcus praedator TaxID=2316724 RepID=A0ABX9QI49_9BACT|nr:MULTISPECIES: YkgJ family cysteine cluster protein [Corallococcus]RKH28429.1 YkgJ family cysteine cluster protein [Corallococcus sp. CA031C]RKI07920.1 YkgJ family cysteine cluster protein [Corallococcus praedator]
MPLSTLCLHCGMCCDGTLFTQVPLQPNESGALTRLGLPLTTREDGGTVLPQPCAALEGRRCTAYLERPEACRRYRCQLLNALAEGEVSLDEAKGVVDAAHARVEAVARALASPQGGPAPMRQARAAASTLPPEAREALTQAEAFLDRHFRGRFRRSG